MKQAYMSKIKNRKVYTTSRSLANSHSIVLKETKDYERPSCANKIEYLAQKTY